MGIFNEFGKRLDSIARSAIDNYKEAQEKAEKAEKRFSNESNPYNHNVNSTEQQARIARARADMLDAQQEKRNAQGYMLKEIDSIKAVGRELQAAINKRFCADSEQVDISTLELLKSGILKPHEYFVLYEKAQKNDNQTMMRLIGKYAGEAAEKAATREQQTQLTTLATNSQYAAGSEYMEHFNAFLDAYSRTANNPLMISRWDEITAGIVSSF